MYLIFYDFGRTFNIILKPTEKNLNGSNLK